MRCAEISRHETCAEVSSMVWGCHVFLGANCNQASGIDNQFVMKPDVSSNIDFHTYNSQFYFTDTSHLKKKKKPLGQINF